MQCTAEIAFRPVSEARARGIVAGRAKGRIAFGSRGGQTRMALS